MYKIIRKRNWISEEIGDIICNMCGKTCCVNRKLNDYEFATLSKNRDGEVHEAHICQRCFDNLVIEFKIPSLKARERL